MSILHFMQAFFPILLSFKAHFTKIPVIAYLLLYVYIGYVYISNNLAVNAGKGPTLYVSKLDAFQTFLKSVFFCMLSLR